MLFQRPQADQRVLQIIVGVILLPRREALESLMRRGGGCLERLVEAPYSISEAFSRLSLVGSRMAGSLTGQGANNIAEGLRIHPALLQNLVRHGPDLVPDGLVFVCRGLSRRRRWLTHGQLPI